MSLEDLVIQRKSLDEIAEFLGLCTSTIAKSLTRGNKPTPSIGSPNDTGYEDRLEAQPSKGEWMHSQERASVR